MNSYRDFAVGTFCLWVALLGTGCASRPQVMVNTWSDPAYTPTAASSIALNIPITGKPEDAAFGQQLLAELKSEAFNVVPEYQADYLLSYVVSDNEVGYETKVTRYVAATAVPQQTTGELQNSIYSPSNVRTVEPSEYDKETRDIRLFLYSNPKTHPGGLRLAWQGTITIEKNASPEREAILLKTLLADFGKNFNGSVKIGP